MDWSHVLENGCCNTNPPLDGAIKEEDNVFILKLRFQGGSRFGK